ncbi:MAG: MerR family transcriptional regulator [Solobacterium sp.]|nr:MerR family transcriptional regulator [Solobacterium sp.]
MKKNAEKEEITYSVGEICTLTGVTRKTLFYYDRIGLLKPYDRIGVQSHKVYDREALERLRSILLYRDAGLQIREVRYLLEENRDRKTVLKEILRRLEAEREKKEYQIGKIKELLGE